MTGSFPTLYLLRAGGEVSSSRQEGGETAPQPTGPRGQLFFNTPSPTGSIAAPRFWILPAAKAISSSIPWSPHPMLVASGLGG